MDSSSSDLVFPIFDTPNVPPKRMSMSEYARFVQSGYEQAAKRDEQIRLRRKTGPVERFRLG